MTTTQLPVLFLNDLVVLPGMVVPVELDDAAKAATDTARTHSDDTLLVAPRLHDRYASYGVVASIVQLGRLQSGEPAAVLNADRRVKIGSGVSGPGTALWIEAEELDPTFETDEVRKLAAEYKRLLIATLQRRDAWQVIDTVNKVTDAGALADLAGYASWLTDEQKRQLLETPYVADRLRVLVEWVTTHIAETEVNDKIAGDVREGMEKCQREFLLRQQLSAIRKELGEDEPEGADDYRGRVEAADLPDDVRAAALREVGKLERASDQSPESGWIRTWLDTVLDLPWSVTTDRLDRPRRRSRGARRRPPRAGRRQGPDRRVPRRPRPARLARPRARRRPRLRRGDGAGRPSRRGQDLARRVRRPGAGPEVRPRRPRRRPRRGRDPRAPAHVRGRAARAGSSARSARRVR